MNANRVYALAGTLLAVSTVLLCAGCLAAGFVQALFAGALAGVAYWDSRRQDRPDTVAALAEIAARLSAMEGRLGHLGTTITAAFPSRVPGANAPQARPSFTPGPRPSQRT